MKMDEERRSGLKFKIPIGIHGYYLPTIKLWNMFAKAIRRDMNKDHIFRGSIEDYIIDGGKGDCMGCGKEMKRVLLESNYFFNGATILCPDTLLESHSREYWIDVWPDATYPLEKKEIEKLTTSELIVARFRLSNPVIKSCWDGRFDDFARGNYICAQEAWPDQDNSSLLPKEEYRHD